MSKKAATKNADAGGTIMLVGPKSVTAMNLCGEEFEVVDGSVEVPAELVGEAAAFGFKRAE